MEMMPVSVCARVGEPSLCEMPAEIRLNICASNRKSNLHCTLTGVISTSSDLSIRTLSLTGRPITDCLLDISNTAPTYGYTGPLLINRKPTLHKHGMVLVSKQLSAEYRQAFYERTKFFLRIYGENAFKGIAPLEVTMTRPNTQPPLPNFWDAPDALLRNLRHCTLFVELGDSACYGALMQLQTIGLGTAVESQWVQGAIFDKAIKDAVGRLLEGMHQLRSVQLVWETTVVDRDSIWTEGWSWEQFGDPFVKMFQEKRTLKSFQIRIADKNENLEWKGDRAKGGKWEVGPVLVADYSFLRRL